MSDTNILKRKTNNHLSIQENLLKDFYIKDDPHIILKNVKNNFPQWTKKKLDQKTAEEMIKALSIYEFEKGALLSTGFPEIYRTFAINFMRELQKEYKCTTSSEKALTELITINYLRIFWLQRKIGNYFNSDNLNGLAIKYVAVLSIELDRANRHFQSSLQTLKALKQPPIEINMKTQTAIVGQNQIVQSNNNDKAK